MLVRLSSLLFIPIAAGCAGAALQRTGAADDAGRRPASPMPNAAAREQTADQQVLHALNRLAFGPRPADAEAVRAMGVDQWIARQLAPARIPDAAGDSVTARYQTLALPLPQLLDEYPPNPVLRRLARQGTLAMRGDSTRNVSRADSVEYAMLRRRSALVGQELSSARVARAVVSERQLDEVMTDFWLNHFNVFAGKSASTRHFLVAYERDAIRPHVLGNFRSLLGAVARSPAMLFYLDNWQSSADSTRPSLVPQRRVQAAQRRYAQRAPQLAGLPPARRDSLVTQLQQRRRGLNENYARELMELHTLGVDGGYTQADVTEAARVLTGWTIQQPNEQGTFRFNPALHDAGEKTVLGRRFAAGQGLNEGEQLLDLLARHPSTARFISRKLVQRFVSDTPPAALVERAAATFTRTNGDIREVVRTIVTSDEFFSTAAWRAKVKSPFEVVVSALRAMNAPMDPTPRTAAIVARLGQGIYQHQAPNGWPETGDGWINTGAILNRINFGMALASGSVPGVQLARWTPYATLNALPREQQVDGVVRTLLGGDVSADMRTILLSGDHPMLPQARAQGTVTDSTDETMMQPRSRMARREPQGLAQIVGLAIGSPEFQRR
jgi:uncharacterized protein (DUF1800 family)